jgi:hypothetical protein
MPSASHLLLYCCRYHLSGLHSELPVTLNKLKYLSPRLVMERHSGHFLRKPCLLFPVLDALYCHVLFPSRQQTRAGPVRRHPRNLPMGGRDALRRGAADRGKGGIGRGRMHPRRRVVRTPKVGASGRRRADSATRGRHRSP